MNNNFFREENKPSHVVGEDTGRTVSQSSFKVGSEDRYGMSNGVWDVTLRITEVILDIIKAVMVVGGIIAANLADVIFGAVGITILFGGSAALFNGTPVWVIATILSMGASAIQIFLWSLIQKRGITIAQLFNWKTLPKDTRSFLGMAFIVWALDTLIDMSPVALLVQNSQYESIQPLYMAMVVAVSVLVFLLCGFSELMTSNMRGMLMATSSKNSNTSYKPKPKIANPFSNEKVSKHAKTSIGANDIRGFMRSRSETGFAKLKDD